MIGLLPVVPLAAAGAPQLLLAHAPMFLLLIVFALAASLDAREGQSATLLASTVVVGLLAALLPMLVVAWLGLSFGIWFICLWTPAVLLVTTPVGAVLGAVSGWAIERGRERRLHSA